MKKVLFLIFILFVIAACTNTTTQKSSTTQQNIQTCTEEKLQNNSGVFLYTEKDAIQQFGGNWQFLGIDAYSLEHPKSIYRDLDCIFDFKIDVKTDGQPNYIS